MDIGQIQQAFIDLIKIPSITGSEGEEKAGIYLENILKQHGIAFWRIEKTPSRPNILAWIKAKEPKLPPLVLISHIDVVDGIEDNWKYPIFSGEIAEGRIYGRGTLDTKQLTMMELYGFLNLNRQKENLKRDVYFLATIDEESGSNYGMEYIKEVEPELFRGAMVINEGGGFPMLINGKSYLMLTVGEKAVCKVKLSATGQGGHASAPGGDQAILKLTEALGVIFKENKQLNFGSCHTRSIMEKILGTRELDNPVASGILNYSGQNSIDIRNFKIGLRSNVIPVNAEVIVDFKVLPGSSVEDIESYLKKCLKDAQVSYEILNYEPGFESNYLDPDLQSLIKELEEACSNEGFDCKVLPMLALGRTDGRFFGSEGSKVYGCSPMLLEDAFDVILPKVHGNDESITLKSFDFGCKVLDKIIGVNCLN